MASLQAQQLFQPESCTQHGDSANCAKREAPGKLRPASHCEMATCLRSKPLQCNSPSVAGQGAIVLAHSQAFDKMIAGSKVQLRPRLDYFCGFLRAELKLSGRSPFSGSRFLACSMLLLRSRHHVPGRADPGLRFFPSSQTFAQRMASILAD